MLVIHCLWLACCSWPFCRFTSESQPHSESIRRWNSRRSWQGRLCQCSPTTGLDWQGAVAEVAHWDEDAAWFLLVTIPVLQTTITDTTIWVGDIGVISWLLTTITITPFKTITTICEHNDLPITSLGILQAQRLSVVIPEQLEPEFPWMGTRWVNDTKKHVEGS